MQRFPAIIHTIMRSRSSASPRSSSNRRRQGRRRIRATTSRPVWEEVLRIARSIPEPDLHKLPTDLAAHHDHYLYGSRGT